MTKAQLITQLNNLCPDDTGITVTFLRTEQYDSNNTNQVDQGGVVNVYKFAGLLEAGKISAQIYAPTFYVQDEGGPNEKAFVMHGTDIDGVFRGQLQTYLDSLAPVYIYKVIESNSVKRSAIVDIAVTDGGTGSTIKRVIALQDNQGVFSYKEITLGNWIN